MYLCLIYKSQKLGGLGPISAAAPQKKVTHFLWSKIHKYPHYSVFYNRLLLSLLDRNVFHIIPFFSTIRFLFIWRESPQCARVSSFTRFLDHTQRRTTLGRINMDERSARHRDLYLTKHNTHNRQTSMSQVGFEPKIPAGERPQIYL